MDPKEWSDRVIYEKGYTKILLRDYVNKNGEKDEWGMVHVNSNGRGASVLALTSRNEVILERSLRIPMKGEVIELPGGLNDLENETPLLVAQRELLEETGYGGGEYEQVAHIADSPGVTDQESILFIARNVEYISAPMLGESEVIATILVPLKEIKKFLKEVGNPIDAKVFAALAFL